MTKKARKTLTIDRGLWGQGKLRRSNGVQCCLGFAADVAGCKGLNGALMPADLGSYQDFRQVWPTLKSDIQEKAADINDSGISPGLEKEKALKALFKEAGIRLRFVGEYSRKRYAVRP